MAADTLHISCIVDSFHLEWYYFTTASKNELFNGAQLEYQIVVIYHINSLILRNGGAVLMIWAICKTCFFCLSLF